MPDNPLDPSDSTAPQQPLSVDPRVLATMYGMARDDEIDLLAYWRIVKKRKRLVLSVMMVVAVLSAGISLSMPNIYKAQVLMAPVKAPSRHGRLASILRGMGGGMGSLTSLAGLSLGSGNSSDEALAILKSRKFLWGFITDNKLMPILYAKRWDATRKAWKSSNPKKQPNLWKAYRLLSKRVIKLSTDKYTGLVTLSVFWKDPVLAASWANTLITRLNDYLRKQAIAHSEANLKYLNEELQKASMANVRQTLFALIAHEQKKAMVANAQKQFAFQVLDPAAPPDRKAKPHRAVIVILATFVAGILASVFVVMRNSADEHGVDEGATAGQT